VYKGGIAAHQVGERSPLEQIARAALHLHPPPVRIAGLRFVARPVAQEARGVTGRGLVHGCDDPSDGDLRGRNAQREAAEAAPCAPEEPPTRELTERLRGVVRGHSQGVGHVAGRNETARAPKAQEQSGAERVLGGLREEGPTGWDRG